MTTTRWEQLLFCTAWVWPAGVLSHYNSSAATDVWAGIFWFTVWLLCGWRLWAKGRWPFRWFN